jgi:hypothetical protein
MPSLHRRLRASLAGQQGGDWWLAGGVSASNAIVVYQPKGAASYADSKINLANPGTYNATEGSAPSWNTSTGWTGNGSSQYLTTGYSRGSADITMIVKLSGTTTNSNAMVGFRQDSAPMRQAIYYSYGTFKAPTYYYTPSGSNGSTATSGDAVIAVSKDGGYINGSLDVSLSGGSAASTAVYYILAENKIGTGADSFASNTLAALAIYNTTLTGAQISAITTALASV